MEQPCIKDHLDICKPMAPSSRTSRRTACSSKHPLREQHYMQLAWITLVDKLCACCQCLRGDCLCLRGSLPVQKKLRQKLRAQWSSELSSAMKKSASRSPDSCVVYRKYLTKFGMNIARHTCRQLQGQANHVEFTRNKHTNSNTQTHRQSNDTCRIDTT